MSNDSDRDDDRYTQVYAALTAYTRTHPQASDTRTGIVMWWIPREIDASAQDVDRALDALVEAGLLRCTPLPDGEALFSVQSAAVRP